MAKTAPERLTVAGLAKRLGLSRATVSFVLNGQAETRRIPPATVERVTKAARRLHYRPNLVAQQLAGKRSNAIGVLISTEAIADVRFIQATELLAAKRGIRFIIGQAVGTKEQVREYLDDFRGRGVDGIISIFHNHADFADVVLPELAQFPNVVYYEKPTHADAAAVAAAWWIEPDYYRVAQWGVEHLLEIGRRRIGEVLNNRTFSYAVHRHRGYIETLRKHGRRPEDELIWIMDEQPGLHWTAPFTDELALQAIDELVVAQRADGLVVVNDYYAARLMRALRLRGRRVPEDVAIIGCDNLEVGELIDPPLTTFDLQGPVVARELMELVFARLEGKELPQAERQRVIEPQLVIRNTT